MKRILVIGFVLAALTFAAGTSQARDWGRGHGGGHWGGHWGGWGHGGGFGIFVAPPPIVVSPYSSYSYDYPYYDSRVWVPGHWETRYYPYGDRQVWVPGHWEYR